MAKDDFGIIDTIKNRLADVTDKNRTGFVPSVCEGCPKRGDGPMKRCGLCGCPTIKNLGLDQAQMTPNGCLRRLEHERRS